MCELVVGVSWCGTYVSYLWRVVSVLVRRRLCYCPTNSSPSFPPLPLSSSSHPTHPWASMRWSLLLNLNAHAPWLADT